MGVYDISARAADDLIRIWEYVQKERGVDATDRLLDKLYTAFQSISDMPGIGRRRPEVEADMQSFPEGDYVIYYKRKGEIIEIARVLHGAQSVEKAFGE